MSLARISPTLNRMERRWLIQKHDHERAKRFASEINVSPLIAALLIARGFDSADKAHRFLNPSYDDLHEPSLLKGMREASERILRAIDNGEKILIWGDYDVDGTTGTTLLRRVVRTLGGTSTFHIPNRFTEGYGVNTPALEKAKGDGVSLVITVDCGIRSFGPLEWAKENGVDVIVTDHHLSDEVRGNPPAFAVVNPNQLGCEYPDKNLAGVGVAFKLAQQMLRERDASHAINDLLKITAIGTVADIMKLTGENRAIVALGLRDLPATKNVGLKALMEVADCVAEMTSYDIGFRIAPRINAAGRMDVARHVVELFECEDFNEARKLASLLDARNRERQKIQQQITELAFQEIESFQGARFLVVHGEGWHRGVIGLAASRIAERVHRPSIVLSVENGVAHGSARSVGSFHLLAALETCADLFEQFGGHAAAAGMKLQSENIEQLRSRLDAFAMENILEEDMKPALSIDAHVSSETLDLKLSEELKCLEPFGAGNLKPVFVTKGLYLAEEPFVMKEKHLRLKLQNDQRKRFEAVWWDGVECSKGRTFHAGYRIEVAYTPEANTWQGNTRLQLVVQDLREHN
ncbi:MAG: single-stranded-DNA-specific exonuclease RecJ [Acidobacteria bacterium]|nr:MAG: single-stranded-DNA-specific exonuclease RecJ [Acidobacteriota bacterium]